MGIGKQKSVHVSVKPTTVGSGERNIRAVSRSQTQGEVENPSAVPASSPNKSKYPQPSQTVSLGADIRALRRSRSMTLQDFSTRLDRSVGFISQIERGLSEPSISDLRNIANIFEVPLSLFFSEPQSNSQERGYIVRSGERRILGGDLGALKEELLSPNLGGSFEILRCEFAPGAQRLEIQPRNTEEAGYLISGSLEIQIDDQWFNLNPGDSFSSQNSMHGWRNPGDIPAIIIWVISPPIY